MVTLEVRTREGTLLELGVPMTDADMTFAGYLDYLAARDAYDSLDADVKKVIAASSLKSMLRHVITGDLDKVPFILPDDLAGDDVPSITAGVSLMRLHFHIEKVLLAALKKERRHSALKYEFDYKGERWYIGQERAITFLSGLALTAGEVIEVHEVKELMDLLIEKKGDPKYNYTYERDLRVVGILAKREGFELPFDINERLAYIEQQMRHFADLSLEVVLDIRFFLKTILAELQASQDIISFLTRRNLLLWKAMETIKLKDRVNELTQKQSAERSSSAVG